jgi:hypothetical protein
MGTMTATKRGWLDGVGFVLGFVLGCLAWPRRVSRGLWSQRRLVWGWLDRRLGGFRAWQRFNARRRLRLVRACARKGHPIRGTLLPNGEPGKMCPTCGYVQQITPKEFKALFGMNVATAVRRTQTDGHRVHNAAKWARTHQHHGPVNGSRAPGR